MKDRRYRIKALKDGAVNLWIVLEGGKTRLLKTCLTRGGAKAFARRHAGEDGVAVLEVLA
ncbi:hypothetical protein [Rhizobium sp. 18065]|uniref:hypothetical protein n=1 Tax=Rhizobium sp. 18065 TaxID=2681411 RepID=UPI001357511D|nr:hypothetical protein [Rhizobium sp. 18065]